MEPPGSPAPHPRVPIPVPGRRVMTGAPVTQQPCAVRPPRAARSPVEMIHHTEQHQGVDHHLLHSQLRHRDTALPPARLPATHKHRQPQLHRPLLPGPSASPSGLTTAGEATSAPRVLRTRARTVARVTILRKGKGRPWDFGCYR